MIIFSCRRAVELTSKELDTSLPLGERMGLGIHRLGCSPCRRFRKQLREIERSTGAYLLEDPQFESEHLSEESKTRILERLNSAPSEGTGTP